MFWDRTSVEMRKSQRMPAAARRNVSALAPWFGSNRMLAHEVGAELAGCKWVGIPFAGGMCEVPYITAPSLVVCDKHRHIINLARVVADDGLRHALVRRLKRTLFHADELDEAQEWCKANEPAMCDLEAAYNFFICCWMGRSSISGARDEFCGRVSIRWKATGGDSNTRFRSAIRGLVEFSKHSKRCNFDVRDVFEFLPKVEDQPGYAVYCDPPFPDAGDEYRHKFSIDDHRKLAFELSQFEYTRVVCRFYDHPLIREIYPTDEWTWRHLVGRKQSNDSAPEVLLINGESRSRSPGLFSDT